VKDFSFTNYDGGYVYETFTYKRKNKGEGNRQNVLSLYNTILIHNIIRALFIVACRQFKIVMVDKSINKQPKMGIRR